MIQQCEVPLNLCMLTSLIPSGPIKIVKKWRMLTVPDPDKIGSKCLDIHLGPEGRRKFDVEGLVCFGPWRTIQGDQRLGRWPG